MTDKRETTAPLPEDWSAQDSHNTFFEYIALCREELRAGKGLPAMFQPRDRGDAP